MLSAQQPYTEGPPLTQSQYNAMYERYKNSPQGKNEEAWRNQKHLRVCAIYAALGSGIGFLALGKRGAIGGAIGGAVFGLTPVGQILAMLGPGRWIGGK
jgi:hypothetical protein